MTLRDQEEDSCHNKGEGDATSDIQHSNRPIPDREVPDRAYLVSSEDREVNLHKVYPPASGEVIDHIELLDPGHCKNTDTNLFVGNGTNDHKLYDTHKGPECCTCKETRSNCDGSHEGNRLNSNIHGHDREVTVIYSGHPEPTGEVAHDKLNGISCEEPKCQLTEKDNCKAGNTLHPFEREVTNHRLSQILAEEKLLHFGVPSKKFLLPDDNYNKGVPTDAKGGEDDAEEGQGYGAWVPDGGYGWVVVLGAFLAQMISDGLVRVSSLFYAGFLDRYRQSATATAWTMAIMELCKLFSSFLGSILATNFSHRSATILAGLLQGVGFMATAFAPSLSVCYVTYAVIGGTGLGISYSLSISMIGMYFDKKKGMASSMAFSGSEVGIISLAPLTQFLLGRYGFSGMCIIMAGICLHTCVSGALYRPLKIKGPKPPLKAPKRQDRVIGVLGSTMSLHSFGSLAVLRDPVHYHMRQNIPDSCTSSQFDVREHSQNVIIGTGTTLKLVGDKDMCITPPGWSERLKNLCKKYQLNILRETQFRMFVFYVAALSIPVNVSIMFISSLAHEKGMTDTQISVMLVVSAAVSIPAKVLMGAAVDRPFIQRHDQAVFCFFGAATAVSLGVLALGETSTEITLLWTLQCCLMIMTWTHLLVILMGLTGPDRITGAIGVMRPIVGVSQFVGIPLGGLLRDVTGSYVWSFVGVAAGCLVVVLLYSVYQFFYFRRQKSTGNLPTGKPHGSLAEEIHLA